MSIIRWEEPPAARAEFNWLAINHELIAVQLRRRPGAWAVVAEVPRNTGLANQINRGKARPYRPAGSFEAVARNHDGVLTIYARFVGEVTS